MGGVCTFRAAACCAPNQQSSSTQALDLLRAVRELQRQVAQDPQHETLHRQGNHAGVPVAEPWHKDAGQEAVTQVDVASNRAELLHGALDLREAFAHRQLLALCGGRGVLQATPKFPVPEEEHLQAPAQHGEAGHDLREAAVDGALSDSQGP
eukprot:UN1215